jgi:predicted NAD/FAD-binding protein
VREKIAIIGSGISGLASAFYLQDKYQVTLFEKNDYLGGHTATKKVVVDEGPFNIDTGFIVFNDWTYPNFNRLLEKLGVESLPTDMGFSVSCDITGLEYSGASLSTLFAQKKRLLSPSHWRLVLDIVAFNKESKKRLDANAIDESLTLGDYVKQLNLSKRFVTHYLIPMGAAIWSSGLQQMYEFPALYFLRFFKNHGLLNLTERPQWSVVKGGSRTYVDKILEQSRFEVKTSTPVSKVIRNADSVTIKTETDEMMFDHVIFACHSDEALKMLESPTKAEEDVLGKLEYQANEVVLHTDTKLLPRLKSTWSSWNYKIRDLNSETATLSYSMNILQRLTCQTQFVVTLNDTASIDPDKILGIYQYSHPVYNRGSLSAQQQRKTINGKHRSWYCGAYWYAGFHEDGIRSALDIVNDLGVEIAVL